MKKLEGQTAIITGGARGLGFAMAKKFAEQGAAVIIADILEKESAEAVESLKAAGLKAAFFIVDIRKTGEIDSMVKFTLKTFGRLDILVNNAGIVTRCPSLKLSEEDFDKVMDVNLKGAFFCSQRAGIEMRKNGGGKIINISSGNSRMMHVGRITYCLSKAGISTMTAALGAEWAMYNIRVNAIAPGFIRTDMVNEGIANNFINEKQILSVSPVERWGTAEEIANLALFLVSDEASYIIGQTYFCDGGWSTGILPNALDYIKENDN